MTKRQKDRQHNDQRQNDRQHNDQRQKDRQHNDQKTEGLDNTMTISFKTEG